MIFLLFPVSRESSVKRAVGGLQTGAIQSEIDGDEITGQAGEAVVSSGAPIDEQQLT